MSPQGPGRTGQPTGSRHRARLYGPPAERSLRVAALGGGHGLSASLQALRHVTEDLTAIVTVADDGGSSGRLRQELGVLPPGDLRMALAALCEDSRWGHLWRDVMQHRFAGEGPLAGHAMGNLLIAALWEVLADPVEGLQVIGDLLGARGRVLPMADVPVAIEADVVDADGRRTIRGQHDVALTRARVERLRLDPPAPVANAAAVQAVMDADWVVMGPGSWFTSVCTHLLVPDLAEALRLSPARRCVTLNLSDGPGETVGRAPEDLLDALAEHAPWLRLDAVVADPSCVEDVQAVSEQASRFGAEVVLRQVSTGPASARHHPLRLAAAYADVFAGVRGDVR